MKYIYDANRNLLVCELYYDLCYDFCYGLNNNRCNSCSLKLACHIFLDEEPAYLIYKNKMDKNDKVWAVQNLQSNNKITQAIATYILKL